MSEIVKVTFITAQDVAERAARTERWSEVVNGSWHLLKLPTFAQIGRAMGYTADDTLTCEGILPGFQLMVKTIFED